MNTETFALNAPSQKIKMNHRIPLQVHTLRMRADIPQRQQKSPMETEDANLIRVHSFMTMEDIEVEAIKLGLKRNRGDKSKTAHELGISVRTIYRKLNQRKKRAGTETRPAPLSRL